MRNENSRTLTKERKDGMIAEIKIYFSKERDEVIGDLAAALNVPENATCKPMCIGN